MRTFALEISMYVNWLVRNVKAFDCSIRNIEPIVPEEHALEEE